MKAGVEPYVTTKPKGTGLGLAIVKKIIESITAREHRNRAGEAVPWRRRRHKRAALAA